MTHPNSFGARATLTAAGRTYGYFRLDALRELSGGNLDRLPFSLKVMLENLLRGEDDAFVKRADVEALARWDVKVPAERRSPTARRAWCCRTSPACPAWSTSRRCATRSPR
jgi:aconitate hydratase